MLGFPFDVRHDFVLEMTRATVVPEDRRAGQAPTLGQFEKTAIVGTRWLSFRQKNVAVGFM